MGVWRGLTIKHQTEIVKRLQAEHAMLLSTQAAPGPKCSLEEATESVSKWPAWKREYSEQHPFLTSQDRKSESTASLVLSRDNHAWLASTTPRPDLIAISEKVWGVRFDGQMICAPTIEEAVTVLRSGLAAKDKLPAAPLCGKRIPETGLGCTLEPGHQGRHDIDVTKVSETPTPLAAKDKPPRCTATIESWQGVSVQCAFDKGHARLHSYEIGVVNKIDLRDGQDS